MNGQLKHGAARRGRKSRLYYVWVEMRSRCRNPRHKAYRNYGGRGIKVSKRWDNFAVFAKDMGQRPTRKHTIERKNNDSGYTRLNTKWALRSEQNTNKRTTKLSCHDVRIIRAKQIRHGMQIKIAERYDLSPAYVSKIIHCQAWRHVA